MPQEPLAIDEVVSATNGHRILQLNGPIVISNLFDLQSRIRSNTSHALILDMTDVP